VLLPSDGILSANISEHTICSNFIGSVNKKNNWEETARVFYLYKYPRNLDLVIPRVHTTYEDGTDRVLTYEDGTDRVLTYEDVTECSKTMTHKIKSPRNHPKERIQHSEHGKCLK
jgi:hypothetical protein